MKKIVFVIDDVTGSGGTKRFTSLMANAFNEVKELSIEIISLGYEKELFFDYTDLKIHYMNGGITRYIKAIKKIQVEKYDSVIVVSMGKLSVIFTLLYKLFLLRPKLILSEHVSFNGYYSSLVKVLKIISYSLADKILILTNDDVNYIQSKMLLNKSNVIHMPNPSPFSKEEKQQKQNNIMLAIGRFSYQKNFDRLLECWKKYKEKNPDSKYILQIVGEGKDKNKLLQLINQYQLNSCVEILVPQKNIKDLYQEAFCVLMTSRYEGLPMVLIEAQTLSVPCIAFDCPTGPKDIIINNKTGFLIPTDASDYDFIDKIELLTKDKILYDAFCRESFLSASRFEINNIINDWIKIL